MRCGSRLASRRGGWNDARDGTQHLCEAAHAVADGVDQRNRAALQRRGAQRRLEMSEGSTSSSRAGHALPVPAAAAASTHGHGHAATPPRGTPADLAVQRQQSSFGEDSEAAYFGY